MCRSFSTTPLDHDLVMALTDDALRAPSAGNSQGVAVLVLEDDAHRSAYWMASTDAAWREQSKRYRAMSRAPVIVLVLCSPLIYVNRYAAPDKASSGLGASEEVWLVPYWYGDAAFATMALLLGAASEELGAAFLGTFRNEENTLKACEVPDSWRLFGTVLLGHPDGDDHPSASLQRTRSRADRVHLGTFHDRPSPSEVDEGNEAGF